MQSCRLLQKRREEECDYCFFQSYAVIQTATAIAHNDYILYNIVLCVLPFLGTAIIVCC